MEPGDTKGTPFENHPQLRISDEYSRIFPINPEEDLALEDSIRTYGQRDPIIVNLEYFILDGHRRFRACMKLGIEPKFEVRTFSSKLKEKRFVLLANVQRRQLTLFQKAETGLLLLGIESEAARKRQKAGRSAADEVANQDASLASIDAKVTREPLKGKAADVVAKEIGLKPATFGRALTILRSNVGEEILQKLRTGELSIYGVYESLRPADTDGGNKSTAVPSLSGGTRRGSIHVKNAKIPIMTIEPARKPTTTSDGGEGIIVDTEAETKTCIGCQKQEASTGIDLCADCLILIRMLRGVESAKLPLGKITVIASASSS